MEMHNKRIVATRLHTNNEAINIDVHKIKKWCNNVLSYCDLLIFVVDSHYNNLLTPIVESSNNRILKFKLKFKIMDNTTLILIGVGALILIIIIFKMGKGRGKSQKKKDIRKKLDV